MVEIKFPIDFTNCPNCGSERRIAESVTNEEIAKGSLKLGQKTPFIVSRAVIFDPTVKLFGKKALVLLGIFDVCADCGTVYCIHAEKGTGTVEPQIPPPTDRMPPGFGRG